MKKTLELCLIAALLLFCGHIDAQEYSLRTFVSADGLGNLTIQRIYQDRAGFVWAGTENGIFRYEGDHFQAFGPAQGIPVATRVGFGEAPDGSLLAGGSIGLYRFSGNRFQKLTAPFETLGWTQSIALSPRGVTYIASASGLYTMASGANAAFTFNKIYPATGAPAEEVHNVLVDGDAVWFGCGMKLCRMEAGKITVFGEESGLPHSSVSSLVKDRAGNLWARIRNEGVLEWPAGEAKFRSPDTPVPGRALSGTPALDHEGRVMLGSPEGLLIQEGTTWRFMDRKVGVRGGVFASLEDRQHTLWMGTGGRGLIQWRGYRQWENYTSTSGLPVENVYEILPQPDGSVWAGTEAGLVHGRRRGLAFVWDTIPATSGIPTHSLQLATPGNLWIGTASKGIGLLHIDTGKIDWFGAKQGLTAKLAFTVRLDRKGVLWAATEAGVFTATPPYTTFTRIQDLPAKWFWTLAESPDGSMWVGGDDGLFSLAAGQWHHWTRDHGLGGAGVISLGPAPDGKVWVGYDHGGGIDRVQLTDHASAPSLKVERGIHRPGTDGLIYFLKFDLAGNLWAGTDHGVDRWDGTRWSHFDTTDGLVWDDCDLGGFAAAPDGSLWFGTSGGLSHFTPRAGPPAPAPGVVFTALRMGQDDIADTATPSFPPSSGAFTARFAAPDAVQNSSLLFRYRLQGQHAPWTETAQRQLEFASLAPGSYALEVQVRDSSGQWSQRGAIFAFSVRTPWYQQGWFVALLVLAPFLGVIVAARIRSQAARYREIKLQHAVKEKTTDLRKANEELLALSMLDALTGLANRRRFDQALSQECARVIRSGPPLSLILIDVDCFKLLNDSAGHQKGDEYLVILARELMSTARRVIDVAARVGGEEFALILPATQTVEARRIAEHFRSTVEARALPHPTSAVIPNLTVSIGVATATADSNASPEALIAAADQALYRAKEQGRNRVEVAG